MKRQTGRSNLNAFNCQCGPEGVAVGQCVVKVKFDFAVCESGPRVSLELRRRVWESAPRT
eukprot:1173035-Rhodomonas_salina.1